jgi:eukaryotic-like serine/threonine-protein kinase
MSESPAAPPSARSIAGSPHARARVGKVLGGKYHLDAVLGEGGTGVVYDARAVAPDAPHPRVALKVMNPAFAGDRHIRGRFVREVAILRRLSGANLCSVLDSGEAGDTEDEDVRVLYLAMPKIEGPTLAQVMAQGPLPLHRALDIMISIARALESAHAQGVVHRDLKPANVLLEAADRVRVVDFGLGKIVSGGGTGTTGLTAHNMVFGTPEYMSPEQARGDEPDARTDVYAAGIMLYEALCGAPPFAGESPLSVLTAHITQAPVPPSHRTSERQISPAAEAVALFAISKEPADRYASAGALAEALAHACANPQDIEGVRPNGTGRAAITDAFAKTIPASMAAPSVRPPSVRARAGASASAPPDPAAVSDAIGPFWIAFWVILALASIAAGVFFALKR